MNYGEKEESHKDLGIVPKIDIITGNTENAKAIAVVIIVNIYLFSNIIIRNRTKAVIENDCINCIVNNALISYATNGKTLA